MLPPPPPPPGFFQPQQPSFQPPPPQQFQQAFAPAAGGGLTAISTATAGDSGSDFLRGFYEGSLKKTSTPFSTFMSYFGPFCVNMAILVGPMWLLRRRLYGSMSSPASGKKGGGKDRMAGFMEMMQPMKPKQYKIDVKGTKFDDVIGIPEAKEDLKQYVDFLSDPKKFTRLGARLPKGCLLTGQPGTGKTLLARAVAGEANRPFLSCSGADFIEIFGGSGPKRVRELFAEAKEHAPCVVFIDEIDAIGTRGGGRSMGGGNSEENRTINQLLAELDGLGSNEAIVVIAATNYPDNIDKALTREGRFDRKINIPMPDVKARNELFDFFLKRVVTGDPECKPKLHEIKTKKNTANDSSSSTPDTPATETTKKDIEVVVVDGVSNKKYAAALADRTPGVSPAQIATIVNEASLHCAVEGDKVVTLPALQNAIDDVLIGKKHRQRMGDASLRRTAYHECGHAIMAWRSRLEKDVIKVSVIPRGRAGGYTQQVQDEALDPKTNEFLFSQLCVLLGGRVAERLFMGDISTGAVDDLQRATKNAMDQLLTYGMSKSIGHLSFQPNEKSDGRAWMNYSEDLHARVEQEARELVAKAYEATVKGLEKDRAHLETLAERLLKNKEIYRSDLEEVLGPRPEGAKSGVAGKETEDAAKPEPKANLKADQ